LKWLARQRADVFCVQELKAQAADMTAEMLAPNGIMDFFITPKRKATARRALFEI